MNATCVRTANDATAPADIRIVLPHHERHLRRKVLSIESEDVLVDLPHAHRFADGDRLVLDDGREIEINAAVEPLYALVTDGPLAHAELCWHLGNRHVLAQVATDRILIARDSVLLPMLEGLGVRIEEVDEPFQPVRGAYHSHD